MKYDIVDQNVIKLLQGDLPVQSHPFAELARELGVKEEAIVERIHHMEHEGVIRRMGAVLRHQLVGYDCNAMVAWRVVEEDRADEVGNIMAGFPNISHCYLREVPEEFGYSLFTMIHARSEAELFAIIEQVVEKTGLRDYIILRSVEEFKKVSLNYIRD